MDKLVIFGTSKYTDLAEHYFETYTDYTVCGYTVNHDYLSNQLYNGKSVVAFEELETYFPPEEYMIFLAIGAHHINEARKRIFFECKERGYRLVSFIHPNALIDPTAKIGEHCIIMENVVVQAFCEIGENSIFFPSSAITHHSHIGAHSFVSSGVIVGGCSTVGERAFIGMSTLINSYGHIGSTCFLSSGCVVTEQLDDNCFLNRDGSKMKINDRSIALLSHLLKG